MSSDTTRVNVSWEDEDGPTSLSFSIRDINLAAFEKKLWQFSQELGPEKEEEK